MQLLKGGWFITVVLVILSASAAISENVIIGILYETSSDFELLNIQLAIEFANANVLINSPRKLVAVYSQLDPLNPVPNLSQVCALVERGVSFLIGSISARNIAFLEPFLNYLRVPVILPFPASSYFNRYSNLVFMASTDMDQGHVITDLLHFFRWTHINFMSHKDQYDILVLRSLLQIAAGASQDEMRATTLKVDDFLINKTAASQFGRIKETGFRINIVSNVDAAALALLDAARVQNLTGLGWTWILSDNDVSMEKFLNLSTSIPVHLLGMLATTLVTDDGQLYNSFRTFWTNETVNEYFGSDKNYEMRRAALWANAFLLAAYAAKDFTDQLVSNTSSLSCSDNLKYLEGDRWLTALKVVRAEGVAQDIVLKDGHLSNPVYSILNMQTSGWQQIATWSGKSGIQRGADYPIVLAGGARSAPDFVSTLNGQHIRVVTIVSSPFLIVHNPKNNSDLRSGEVEGLAVDLVEQLAVALNFTYRIYLVPDNTYGAKNAITGEWNGMIKEVLLKRADMIVADFTITRVRSEAVDFSTPFIDLGLQFIGLKDNDESALFEFMKPLDQALWGTSAITALTVTILLGLFEKLSPYGSHGEFVHTYHDTEKENRLRRTRKRFLIEKKKTFKFMNLFNSFWYSLASMLQQGYEGHPRATSSRLVVILWWLAVIVIISTYTAQLGAFIITEQLSGSVNSAEDLYKQDRIKYSFLPSGAVESFFCGSSLDLYKGICKKVHEFGEMTTNVDVILQRILNPAVPYALVKDSTWTDNILIQYCQVRKIGGLFGKQGFGISFPKGAPFADAISQQVMQLREIGFMDHLKEKWYTNRTKCPVSDSTQSAKLQQNTVWDLRGVFSVIVAAFALTPLVLVVEISCSACGLRMSNAYINVPRTFCGALMYRFSRMKRDLFMNYVPDRLKDNLGLDTYKKSVQKTLWHSRALQQGKERLFIRGTAKLLLQRQTTGVNSCA